MQHLRSRCCVGMVAASLACLERQGALLEVAKRDIWSPQRVAQERPDVRFQLVAIDFWDPQTVGRNLRRLAHMLASGSAKLRAAALLCSHTLSLFQLHKGPWEMLGEAFGHVHQSSQQNAGFSALTSKINLLGTRSRLLRDGSCSFTYFADSAWVCLVQSSCCQVTVFADA